MKPLYALLSLIGLTCLPAHATVYTIDYTAKVSSVKVSPDIWSSGAEVGSTTLPGSLIAVGDTVHGKIIYDSDMPSYGIRDYYDRQRVDYDGSHVMLTAQFAPSGFSFTPNSYIWAGQYKINQSMSSDPDGFTVGGYRYAPDGSSREMLSIAFRDSTHTKLDLTKVPGQILTTLSTDGLYYEFDGANGRADIQSNIMSFTITSSVPEPETYAMLVAGLGLLGWCRRKSRS